MKGCGVEEEAGSEDLFFGLARYQLVLNLLSGYITSWCPVF